MLLFKILDNEYTYTDIVDFVIVVLLMIQLFRLVRGTIVFNIFIGILVVYIAFITARFLKLELLHDIFGQFINVGVIALLIVFQPEIRKFLLVIGRVSFMEQFKFMRKNKSKEPVKTSATEHIILDLQHAIENFSKSNTGALLVFSNSLRLHDLPNAGVELQAIVSEKILESIFNKTSPLHDGAVIIAKNKIVYAGTVLPVSESKNLPANAGLRHRAAIGITEVSEATAIIVSEETGKISVAKEGKVQTDISENELNAVLHRIYDEI